MSETRKPVSPRDMAELSPDDLLTQKEVADYFGVSARTLRNWAHDGLLPVTKTPGKVRYRWGDVRALTERFAANRE